MIPLLISLFSPRIHDLESQGLYSNPVQFYDFLQNRVLIHFRPRFEEPDESNEFSLVLSKKHNYDMVKKNGFEYGLALNLARCR